jgi:hypothetical protein
MKVRSGTILVLALVAILIGGWFIYRTLIPPTWLHNFAADIALRATPDPDAPPPEDTRQATPRGLASSPYICLRKLIHFSWDRFVVVPSNGDPREVAALKGVEWPDNAATRYAALMAHDPRYQLIVLLKDNRVVADDAFFTFWGDLSALATPDGFTPDSAVFAAIVQHGHYVLAPVPSPFPSDCG